MSLEMTRVEVWAKEIDDQPGALARTLTEIANAGGDLDAVIARRDQKHPGRGTVFVTPLAGRKVMENADQIGLHRVTDVHTLRLEGHNEAGIESRIAKIIADAGINMHGLTAIACGHRFVSYIGFDSVTDLQKAQDALNSMAGHDWRFWRHREAAAAEAAVERR